MTQFGPVDREDLNTGCPGGPPIPGVPFTLEVTIEHPISLQKKCLSSHNGVIRYIRLNFDCMLSERILRVRHSFVRHFEYILLKEFIFWYLPSDSNNRETSDR